MREFDERLLLPPSAFADGAARCASFIASDALRPDVDELEPLIEAARADDDVVAVLLFGSAARGEPYRDLDVAVVARPGTRDTWDVLMRYASDDPRIDVKVFQDLPMHVRIRVLRDARPLFVRDEDLLYRIAFETTREWEDFREFVDAYLEGVGRA